MRSPLALCGQPCPRPVADLPANNGEGDAGFGEVKASRPIRQLDRLLLTFDRQTKIARWTINLAPSVPHTAHGFRYDAALDDPSHGRFGRLGVRARTVEDGAQRRSGGGDISRRVDLRPADISDIVAELSLNHRAVGIGRIAAAGRHTGEQDR